MYLCDDMTCGSVYVIPKIRCEKMYYTYGKTYYTATY
jgi:hypothetical protein